MATPTAEQYPQLISLAVHEFRTPASVVGGYLRMLLRDTDQPLSDRHKKMVEEAERSCARLVALIAELSDIGKLDGGLLTLNPKPLDVFELVTEVANHVHEAEDRDVHLALRGDGAGAPMSGDRSRLSSAFDAVFRALLRERVGPATIVVDRRRASIDGRSCAVVIVADEPNVQEAYGRQRDRFDEKRGGMGLALPLARRVFEGHGGQIWSPEGRSTDATAGDPVARGSAIIALPVTE